ncbi:MAG: hypothetical protein RL173_2608 [Fibrobacterota bacterium]|jgi:triacylglycerol lipase
MKASFLFVAVSILVQTVFAGQTTILLHGLSRTNKSMVEVEKALKAKSHRVFNIDYPSRKFPIDSLAEIAIGGALRTMVRDSTDTLNFVTHSLGGILVREYMAKHKVPRMGRVVMLGPPNHGSEVVDNLKGVSLFSLLNGPAGQELGTDSASKPNSLGAVDYEVGVIAGDRSINWINSLMIPGPDDGKVSTGSARLAGMKDYLLVHATHPMMMKNAEVIRQILCFLATGRFDRPSKG